MNEKALIEDRSSLWATVGQFIAAVTGVVVTFVSLPPLLFDAEADMSYISYLNVVCGVIFLFVLVLAKRYAKVMHSVRMSTVSLVLVLVASISMVAYSMTSSVWSCKTYRGDRLVIGRVESDDARAYRLKERKRLGKAPSCADMIDEYGRSDMPVIWGEQEMRDRFYTLLSWFFTNVIIFTSAIILAIESAVGVLARRKEDGKP